MVEVGNEISNKFWQHRLPEDDQISPDSSRCVHVLSCMFFSVMHGSILISYFLTPEIIERNFIKVARK